MTTFFNYFIISHPLIVLCIYLFMYCCLGKYIADFGKLLHEMDVGDEGNKHGHQIDNKDWFDEPSLIPSEFSSFKEDGSYNGFHKVIGKRKKGNPMYGVGLFLRPQSVPLYGIKKVHIGEYHRESVG